MQLTSKPARLSRPVVAATDSRADGLFPDLRTSDGGGRSPGSRVTGSKPTPSRFPSGAGGCEQTPNGRSTSPLTVAGTAADLGRAPHRIPSWPPSPADRPAGVIGPTWPCRKPSGRGEPALRQAPPGAPLLVGCGHGRLAQRRLGETAARDPGVARHAALADPVHAVLTF